MEQRDDNLMVRGAPVSGLGHRSPGPEADRLHQDPRLAADRRHVAQDHGRHPVAPARKTAFVR